jgi:DNA-binding NarL/FixJ family response regulator
MIVDMSVLVVDDDPGFRWIARPMLAACGLAVVGEAETVATAMLAANELRPDAALVDVGLPDGDGIALACELAALPWRPRVLLTSIDPDAVTADDLRSSGAEGFVAKDELPDAPLARLLATATA